MGLPENRSAWPPADDTDRYSRMVVNSAWYGGDPNKLANLYGRGATQQGQHKTGLGGFISNVFGWFWAKEDPTQPDDKIHVPLAQDIATLSSELLFAKTPRFVVQHSMFLADGTPDPAQDAQVAKTQARLDKLLDNCQFDALLLAAAEISAALGSTGLRIAWQQGKTRMPVITRVDADACVPEYSFGQLTAVTFWSIVKRSGETLWYHLERHEQGAIYHGLYKGERGNLGIAVPLEDAQKTAHLAPLVNAEGALPLPPLAMTAVSIPNMLPDPLDRANNAGRSDFTPGVITLFDAIDKSYTSLMRDIDDGKSKLIIADYMLESKGAGKGVEFDNDQHLFTKLKMSPGDDSDAPITQVQFKIRVEEHIKAIELLTAKAVKSAGYSPQSMGDYAEGQGAAVTATEIEAREKRSLSTRQKKLRYFQLIEQLLESLLIVDQAYYDTTTVPLPVRMEVPSIAEDTPRALAETAKLMKEAEASSIRVRVAVMHPDWDDSQIDDEVLEIQNESSVVDPSTFGLPLAPPPADDEDDEDEPADTLMS